MRVKALVTTVMVFSLPGIGTILDENVKKGNGENVQCSLPTSCKRSEQTDSVQPKKEKQTKLHRAMGEH